MAPDKAETVKKRDEKKLGDVFREENHKLKFGEQEDANSH